MLTVVVHAPENVLTVTVVLEVLIVLVGYVRLMSAR